MRRKTIHSLSCLAAGLLLALAGCGESEATAGSARLSVSLHPSLSPQDITRVTVTLTASDLSTRSEKLALVDGQWTGTLAHIPPGSQRTFSAEAFDSHERKRFEGRAEDLFVPAGQELVVTLTLQSTDGGADLDASLNRRPVLASLTASPARVDVGQRTTLAALVSDLDGDVLTYQWSATGCSGRIEDATSASARFTPDALPSGDACGSCRLSFLATDARGAQARGSLGLCLGPVPSVSLAPQVVDVRVSDTFVGIGEHVRLSLRAWDPQGSALTFSWELAAGSLHSGPTHTATTSEAVWVTPSCIPLEAHPPLRVVIRNTRGQTATATFPLTPDGVPTCNHWASTGSLATPRQGHTATLLGSGQVLVAGGTEGTQALASAELYDPVTGTWTSLRPMNTPRVGHTATRLDGDRVLVVGGYSALTFESLTSAEIHDPLTGQWSFTASMDTPRHGHTATRLSWGGVLIAGGRNRVDQLSNVEMYLPGSNTWLYQGDMKAIRYQHTTTLLPDDKVLSIGGQGTGAQTAELFDYITGRFSVVGTLSRARSRHTATVLSNGKVLITGGDVDGMPTDSAELYDLVTRTSTLVPPMSEPRAGHTATVLPHGKVLIVGGTSGGGAVATAELYDPTTGLWSPARAMRSAKEGHTAILLGSGRVLVTGGATAGAPSSASELYTP